MDALLSLVTSAQFFRIYSLAGTLFVVLGAIVSAAAYRGKEAERYSLLNHYISELGERGTSRLAWVFNLGLILGGICLLPACISFGLMLPGVWSKLGMAAGIIAAVSLSLVGVFPMDRIEPHSKAAITYFRSGLVMVIFFTLAVFLQKDPVLIHRVYSLVGLPAIASFSFFLIYSTIVFRKEPDFELDQEKTRPKFWGVTLAEWMIFLTTVPFFLLLAFGI